MTKAEDLFNELLYNKGVHISEQQARQFQLYFQELVIWNEKMNLTGITDEQQVYIKHFYDSVSVAFFAPVQDLKRLADIGSGAGFPSIPLKIVYPHLQVTIIDSLNKRIQFLQHLTEQLQLQAVECVHGRAEDGGRNSSLRDQFDLVTARAVAKLNVLGELCLPFVKPGGLFAAMKGGNPADEIAEAGKCLRELKAEVEQVHRLELPLEHSERHIVLIRKWGVTPRSYPRKAGTPVKTPLA